MVLEERCTQVLRTFNERRIEILAAVNLVHDWDAHGALQGRHMVAITFFVGKTKSRFDLIALLLSFIHFFKVLIVTLRFFG